MNVTRGLDVEGGWEAGTLASSTEIGHVLVPSQKSARHWSEAPTRPDFAFHSGTHDYFLPLPSNRIPEVQSAFPCCLAMGKRYDESWRSP